MSRLPHEDPLRPRERLFVQHYLADFNATQAAIKAGYTDNLAAAGVQAHRLLKRAKILDAIDEETEGRQRELRVDAMKVLRELITLAFSDIGEVLDFSRKEIRMKPANQIRGRARKCIQSFKVKRHMEGAGEFAKEVEVIEFKLYDKLSALEKLARHLGLLKEKEPLEVLLNVLPSEFGVEVRSALAGLLSHRGNPGSNGNGTH